MPNSVILEDLFSRGAIKLERGVLFDTAPPPKAVDFDFNKVEGMLLGVAIGDSLGITTEGMPPHLRKAAHGEVRDYIVNRHVHEPVGLPSDDTQLTYWTLDQLIADEGFVPENVANRYASSGRIVGIGQTVLGFLTNLGSGKPWHESGPESAGNGALMRIAPMLLPHLRTGGTGLWIDTALSAMMTHNDRASISACLAFVAMLWELLDKTTVPDRWWWLQRYLEIAADLEGEAEYSPRGGHFVDYSGPLWRFAKENVSRAARDGLPVLEACESWYSGAYLLETVPSVLYILMTCAHDPEEAIVRAVNDTADNDTIAAIVGAAVGALHGRRAFPDRWIGKLTGRTTHNDDGRVFELLDNARKTFWEGPA